MASLNILCFNLENISWPIKNFEKDIMTDQYMPKIFHDPHKNPPPPLLRT